MQGFLRVDAARKTSIIAKILAASTRGMRCGATCCKRYTEWRARFRRPGAVAISVPSRGVRAKRGRQPSGLKALMSVSATRRPRASSRPPYDENSQLLSQPAAFLFAERARFELAIPFWGTHAFQACLFSHSSISPIRIPGNRDCKGNHFFRKCKCRRLNFSTGDYKVRLWSMQPGYSSG